MLCIILLFSLNFFLYLATTMIYDLSRWILVPLFSQLRKKLKIFWVLRSRTCSNGVCAPLNFLLSAIYVRDLLHSCCAVSDWAIAIEQLQLPLSKTIAIALYASLLVALWASLWWLSSSDCRSASCYSKCGFTIHHHRWFFVDSVFLFLFMM